MNRPLDLERERSRLESAQSYIERTEGKLGSKQVDMYRTTAPTNTIIPVPVGSWRESAEIGSALGAISTVTTGVTSDVHALRQRVQELEAAIEAVANKNTA